MQDPDAKWGTEDKREAGSAIHSIAEQHSEWQGEEASWLESFPSQCFLVRSLALSSDSMKLCDRLKRLQDAGEPLLPFWIDESEKSEHVAFALPARLGGRLEEVPTDCKAKEAILEFHTEPCADFQRGFCAKHGIRGKAPLHISDFR